MKTATGLTVWPIQTSRTTFVSGSGSESRSLWSHLYGFEPVFMYDLWMSCRSWQVQLNQRVGGVNSISADGGLVPHLTACCSLPNAQIPTHIIHLWQLAVLHKTNTHFHTHAHANVCVSLHTHSRTRVHVQAAVNAYILHSSSNPL